MKPYKDQLTMTLQKVDGPPHVSLLCFIGGKASIFMKQVKVGLVRRPADLFPRIGFHVLTPLLYRYCVSVVTK